MIDKRLLVDSVQIQKPTGKDEWGAETFSAPLVLSPVKFDRNLAFTGIGNSRSENKPSVLLVYPKFCPVVLDKSYRGGKVIADGTEYIIRQIIPQYHPCKKEVLCYEVEVV